MKKILITGCNGFLGKHLSRFFAAQGNAVYGIDVAGSFDPQLAGFVAGPITPAALQELGEPFDCICHLAGPGTINAADQNAAAVSRCVSDNMRIILESTRNFPETQLLFPSSAAVYGDQAISPIPEEAPFAPLSAYGSNKATDEKLCEEYHRKYKSRIAIIRFFSIYGPGLRKQLLWDFSRRLADSIQAGKDSVPCFGTGDETRDYIFIDDVVKVFAMLCDRNIDWLVVNAGTGTSHSVRQVLAALVAAYQVKIKLDFDGVIRQGNPMHLIADVKKLQSIGFAPSVSFDEGIARYARWAAEELLI